MWFKNLYFPLICWTTSWPKPRLVKALYFFSSDYWKILEIYYYYWDWNFKQYKRINFMPCMPKIYIDWDNNEKNSDIILPNRQKWTMNNWIVGFLLINFWELKWKIVFFYVASTLFRRNWTIKRKIQVQLDNWLPIVIHIRSLSLASDAQSYTNYFRHAISLWWLCVSF